MSSHGYISVRNWTGSKGFQHYDPTKRGLPPWIKNYTRLLQDDDYLELSEHCALILHRLWLAYAQSACRLPADTRKLSQRLAVRVTKSHLDSLNHAGFIDIVASKELADGYHSASKALASARLVTETETETEGLDRSSRSEITGEPRPDLTDSEDPHKGEEEQPFAREPEPPLNGTRDGYGPQPLSVDVEELVGKWAQETP